MRRTPHMLYASFRTTSVVDDLSILNVVDPMPPWVAELQRMRQAHYNPSMKDIRDRSLIKYSLLSVTDDFSYTGLEFEHQWVCVPTLMECMLGGETFMIEVFQYPQAYMSPLKEGTSQLSLTDQSALPGIPGPTLRMDNRVNYEEVPLLTDVTCATHSFGVQDKDSPEMWWEIVTYLKMNIMPSHCENAMEQKSFIHKAKNFFLHNRDHLWKIEPKGKIPCLVVLEVDCRSALVAEVHNDVGHWGCDTMYKTLSEHFFWPNMYNQIAYFVHSCNVCQLWSKTCPIIAFSPTWNSGILRRFDLDTIHMPDGFGGMKFLLQATDPSISWVEAWAVRCANSESWAKFLYEEVYCWFRCILLCLIDGGSEFKGAVEILFKQYGIVAIMSSLYHPEGNGHSEHSHQMLVNSIFQACGMDASCWLLYIHAGLWAMHCSTSRVTGYPPYFLLYGHCPFFTFDFADKTWDTLDWHNITSTEDLLALQMQQVLWQDKKLVLAMEQQKKVHQQAVDNFNCKHAHYLSSGTFLLGTWVLLHETWLDSQMGNKGALRWTGLYIIHHQYVIQHINCKNWMVPWCRVQ